MVAEHVHHTHLGDGNRVQLRPLRHAGPHQQASVGAAYYGQSGRTGIALLYQPFSRSDEIIEHILLVHLGPGHVPCLAVLAASAQVDLRIDAAGLKEGHARGRESRGQGYVESAVSIQVNGVLPVELQALAVGQEHGDAGAVL